MWNFFAIFGVDPVFLGSDKLYGMIIAFIVGNIMISIITLLVPHKGSTVDSHEYSKVWSSFYTYLLVLPALYLVASIELILLIVFSCNYYLFIAGCIIVGVSYIAKFIYFDIIEGKISLFGLVAFIQKAAVKYIVVENRNYPLQTIIENIIATREIRSIQNQYLEKWKTKLPTA